MELSDALSQASIKVNAKLNPSASSDVSAFAHGVNLANEITANFFDVPHPTQEQATKLNEIYDWAKEHTDGTDLEVLNTLRDIRFRLGSPTTSQSQLDRIHTYIRLRSKAQSYENQAKALEK